MKKFYLEKSLGIDIRENSVCLTLLGKTLYRLDVLASKYIPIEPLSKENEKAESLFLEKVNAFMIEHNAWTENVVVSIPRSNITFQSFKLPSPDRESVDSMMAFELERHFSSSLDNLYYSNHITTKKDNQYHIACAAIKKETANYYLSLLKKLNLNVSILDVSIFANLNIVWLNDKNQESLSVLVDLSSNDIEISILIQRELEFSRNIPIVDPMYRDIFLNIEKQTNQINIETINETLVEEIKKALSSCRNIDNSKTVDAVFVSGGGHLAPKITAMLESAAGVQVFRPQLPSVINSELPKNYSTAFMGTSLGLAMRETKQNIIETNLLPDNLNTTKKKKINVKNSVGLALATILFLFGFMINQSIQNKIILTSLDKQLDEIKVHMGPLEKVDLEYNELQKYTNTLNRIDEQNPTKLPLLLELSQIIPKDTWLKKIKFENKNIKLNGVSINASQLIPIIENSNHFRDTHFVGTIITESIGEKFTINAAIGGNSG